MTDFVAYLIIAFIAGFITGCVFVQIYFSSKYAKENKHLIDKC